MHTHQRGATAGRYRQSGEFAEAVRVDQPWPIEFDIARITPRCYRP